MKFVMWGCGGRRRFWQSHHVQCARREWRVESERGKNRTNRTRRRRGKYSRSKRLSSLLLLHMYATAYYTIVRPYRHPTRRRTPLFSLYGQHPHRQSCGGCCWRRRFYRLCVWNICYLFCRGSDSLHLTLTKTVFNVHFFFSRNSKGTRDDVCIGRLTCERDGEGWWERRERKKENQFRSESTLGPPRVVVINHMGSKMRF